MGRTITSFILIAAIIMISVGGILFAQTYKNETDELSAMAQEYCVLKDRQKLCDTAQAMQSKFEKKEWILSLYVRHDELEKLTQALIGLNSYAESGAFESAYSALSQIDFMTEHILAREVPNIDNIL